MPFVRMVECTLWAHARSVFFDPTHWRAQLRHTSPHLIALSVPFSRVTKLSSSCRFAAQAASAAEAEAGYDSGDGRGAAAPGGKRSAECARPT